MTKETTNLEKSKAEMVSLPNNNQKLIDDLRAAADYFAARPDLPGFYTPVGDYQPRVFIHHTVNKREELASAVAKMGSVKKVFNDYYLTCTHEIGKTVEVSVQTAREKVCTKRIVWDCPDDESLLKLVADAEGGENVPQPQAHLGALGGE